MAGAGKTDQRYYINDSNENTSPAGNDGTGFLHHEKNAKKWLFSAKKTPERYSPGEIQLHPSPILVTHSVGRVLCCFLSDHFRLNMNNMNVL